MQAERLDMLPVREWCRAWCTPPEVLEVTDSGEYYLTVRLGMMDYASGHSFWVQNVGDSGWSAPAVGQTGSGSDGNGTTADICIQVPSENCVVRASMYVEPMGREVIYYFYPSGYSEGNTTDMTATMVTAASGSSETANNTSGCKYKCICIICGIICVCRWRKCCVWQCVFPRDNKAELVGRNKKIV